MQQRLFVMPSQHAPKQSCHHARFKPLSDGRIKRTEGEYTYDFMSGQMDNADVFAGIMQKSTR